MRHAGWSGPIVVAIAAGAVLTALSAMAAGQSGGPYAVAQDVVVFASPPIAVGSASYQIIPSVAQHGAVGAHGSAGVSVNVGFLSKPPAFDLDGDGIPDASDPDVDGDGAPNQMDARPYDTDNDGFNNYDDDDDDNDGLSDVEEIHISTDPLRRDTDGDGFDDGVEVRRLGTDPVNQGDFLRCTQVTTSAGAMIITWASSTQATGYLVQRASNVAGAGDWTTIAGPMAPTGTTMSVIDPSPPRPAMYRVAVPPP